MHFTCRSFIGSTNKSNWSQYWENEPDDLGVIKNKGHLFGLINLYSPNEIVDINQLGRQLIDEFNNSYFSNPSSINQALNSSLENLQKSDKLVNFDCKIIIACICQKQLYIVSSPNISAIICRQNKLSHLIEINNQNSFINGPLLDKDLLFFSTAEFFNFATLEKIQNYLSSDNIQTIEENFISLLYSDENQDKKSAFLLEIHHPQEETEVEVPIVEKKEKINFFIKRQNPSQVIKRKKIYLFYAILLLLALTTITVFGYRKSKNQNLNSKYQEYKNQLEEKLKNIEAVRNLSFESAQEEIIEAQKIVENMNLLNINKDEVSKYFSNLDSLLDKTGSAPVSSSRDIFYDTNNIDNNLNFSQIIFSQNTFYLLEENKNIIYSLAYPEKSINLIYQGEEKLNAISLAQNNKILYLLNNSGIFEVNKDKLISKIKFEENIKPLDFAFWNSAIYLLESSQNTLFKYPPNASGFSSAQKWIKGSEKTSINSISLAINGKIWVLSSDGIVQPFDRGDSVKFEISPPIETNFAKNLSVTQENDILVFHDDEFVYVFKKDGQGVAKYNFQDIKILDITLNESDNFIFILGKDQKIYKISL